MSNGEYHLLISSLAAANGHLSVMGDRARPHRPLTLPARYGYKSEPKPGL